MSNASDSSGERLPQAKSQAVPILDSSVVDPAPMHGRQAVSAEAWLVYNQAALESSNAFVRETGLPLAKFRNF
jgi:post-segregation antitoxin (ccd killing protein)